jgi:S-(hydroxymethyl)glutathione dehydrogenase/alcohol dehydrogenase
VKAAVCHAFGQPLAIEQVDLEPPQPGEVRVRLKACGICHSDIHYMDGHWGGRLPAVYGHEGAGVVEQLGDGVEGVEVGDRVVVSLVRTCGHCFHCSRDEGELCETQFPIDAAGRLHDGQGTELLQGLRCGAFAEAVVVHQSQIVPVPDHIPFESASLLACGVITGWGAVVKTAGLEAGSRAAVIGVGGVGINSVQAAALRGAETVVAIDLSDAKLETARSFGATHVLNPERDDVAEQCRALSEGRGLDYVFVTVGNAKAIQSALKLIRRGGALVLVGMPASGDLTELQAGDLAGDGQRILGSKMGCATLKEDVPTLVGLYEVGRLKLDELVTGRYPLERINDAIDDARGGGALRNVVVFD